MKIGIISDTHGSIDNLKYCLTYFCKSGVTTVIHCGDLGRENLIRLFENFRLIFVFGNCDKEKALISREVDLLNPESFIGESFDGIMNGKRVFAAHGHQEDVLKDRIMSQEYDFIFSGHTHRRRDEMIEKTRVINPGALGGIKYETRSFMILDLETDKLLTVEVQDYL